MLKTSKLAIIAALVAVIVAPVFAASSSEAAKAPMKRSAATAQASIELPAPGDRLNGYTGY